jgi:uncharacterized membrane-anchored protein
MSVAAAVEKVSHSSSDARQDLRSRAMGIGRPKKYHTEEERREAARQRNRKYYNAHREALSVRRAETHKTKRAAIKAG